MTLKPSFVTAAIIAFGLALPTVGHAQGVARGAAQGAETGSRAAGPVGGAVGGAVGGVVGGVSGAVEGILGVDDRPRFREYVEQQHRPSYRYREEVRVGARLPASGVKYYPLPAEYNVKRYRYTVVNDRPV